jgi:hypothetical protein
MTHFGDLQDRRVKKRGVGISRRKFLQVSSLGGSFLLGSLCLPSAVFGVSSDYARLVEMIRLDDREQPLYAFNDFSSGFDVESHEANVEYFDEHPDLLTRIREDLGPGELRWKLDTLKHRLVFVPETRREYAAYYEKYCAEVIGYVLGRTKLDNPYRAIETLLVENPEIPETKVTAYLVHNLAKEFVATYIFSKEDDKKVKIKLAGKVFSGVLGSYTSNIFVQEDGSFAFERATYTIWQNSAGNPYTALAIPVEETLHIALRDHTEREMKEQLSLGSVSTIGDVQRIVREWMTIEEAAVGGLVQALLPEFLNKHLKSLPHSLIAKDIEARSRFEKYKYLRRGIELVKKVGCHTYLKIYAESPRKFRELLM